MVSLGIFLVFFAIGFLIGWSIRRLRRTREQQAAYREAAAWAVDKLEKWEVLLVAKEEWNDPVTEHDVATCREILHGLSDDNPKLAAKRE